MPLFFPSFFSSLSQFFAVVVVALYLTKYHISDLKEELSKMKKKAKFRKFRKKIKKNLEL
jgi:hypothetical protein